MEKLAAGDPRHIGAYRLLARLGTGGMGQVYLARSERGRTVAVKLVHRELAEQEQFRGRFRQEVAAARRVGGAWTAPVLDADTEAEVPWLATGYVAGPSLQSVVSGDHGPLPERSVLILASGLAHALQDIHAAGLIHRDLKPSNVLVTIEGPRVIDFGIARALETVADEGLTRTGALVGSPAFMSPEQVRGDRVTAACDVFCLGSVLAYAATGRLPFGGTETGAHALMFRIAQEEPDLSALPDGLVQLVRGCLRKDPAMRPTTYDILAKVGESVDVQAGLGGGGEPWLPGGLLARLGQHAVRLLEHEDPTRQIRIPEDAPGAAPAKGPAPEGTGTGTGAGAGSPAGAGAGSPAGAGAGNPPPSRSTSASPVTPNTPITPTSPVKPTASTTTATAATSPTAPKGQVPAQAPAPASYGYPQPGYGGPGVPGVVGGVGGPNGPTGPTGPTARPLGGAGAPVPPSPSFGSAPPYGTTPEPPRRNARGTAALIVVAVIVAVCAGASVYAFMGGEGATNAQSGKDGRSATSQPSKPGVEEADGSPSPTRSPDEQEKEGDLPKKYVGTWSGGVDTSSGYSTRQLVIEQGAPGDAVMTLTAEGPLADGGTYKCVFQAPLVTAPSSDTEAPVHIGPSRVISGNPASACSPGPATQLTVQPDGTLRRVTTSGESLTYTKSD
ncbi:protein kinase [Streptomyces sp. NPDC088258]|uniref:serine/threonine-protein kinase n=1 Tax=Streptomyces sp. NPDC088258 TaxID=3365849 RepID=UPI0038206D58